MNLLSSCAAIAVAGVAALGCSAGEDVYVESTNKSELSCTLSAGENICARDWSGVGDSTEIAAYLESVANFAGTARDLVNQLDLACTEMLASANTDVPPAPETTPERMTAKCKVLVETIRARSTSGFEIEVRDPAMTACTTLSTPSCIHPPKQRIRCPAPSVTLTSKQGDSAPNDAALAGVLENGFSRVFLVRDGLERTVDLTAEGLTTPPEQLPACLAHAAASLISQASHDLRSAAEMIAELVTALDR
ncbi:MAG: hypothetical protein KF894_00700 [Labilithrix sp.]|nr:hypothetical protein [Labilithrix sp.]